ncbi:hypothetical protein DEH69_06305 [Streptomyces sp. PT12]|nr:hypothetical protein DEH69_06305 [Streptomyces sp. PT12]
MDEGDTRRWLGAQLHQVHLERDTLCVHAVGVRPPDEERAVLLLGGHGAGKSLVALGLVEAGWRVLAGDVALLNVAEGRISAVGGTAAFVVRRAPVRRWFPGLGLDEAGPATLDLGDRPELTTQRPMRPVPLTHAVLVDVDGDPAGEAGVIRRLDAHTAATVWLRASGHLLDRVTENAAGPALCEVEGHAAHRRRLGLVRLLANAVPTHAGWGAPQGIAARVATGVWHERP